MFVFDILLILQEMRSVEFMGRNLFVQQSKDTPDRKLEDGRAKRQKRDHFESQVGQAESIFMDLFLKDDSWPSDSLSLADDIFLCLAQAGFMYGDR